MKLRRLNLAGIRQFEDYIKRLRQSPTEAPPTHILTDDALTELVQPPQIVEGDRPLTTRKDAAVYLQSLAVGQNRDRDRGLWSWLTLLFFNQTCPPDAAGQRHPKDMAKYIPEVDDYRKRYRHLLLGPVLLIQAMQGKPEPVAALLVGPLHQFGELPEQVASRQELVGNPAVLEIVNRLYLDASGRSLRPGASSKGAGSVRRLADVLGQLDLTWDLAAMPADAILAKLPQEFDRFRPRSRSHNA